MDNLLPGFQHSEIYAFLVLLTVCATQLGYLLISRKNVNSPVLDYSISAERYQMKRFLRLKLLGFMLFGIIPFVLFYLLFVPDHYFVEPISSTWQIPDFLLAALPALIILLNFFAAGKKDFYDRFPQMRITEWGIPHLLISIMGWGIYLLGYEYLFRGLFLSAWLEAFGPVTAIVANVLVYSLFHIPNGKNEAIGAIPFGIVLCLLTLQSGTFVPALLLHWVLSVSAEMFSVYHHPEMQFKLKKIYLWKSIS